jgi:hypothetical protein
MPENERKTDPSELKELDSDAFNDSELSSLAGNAILRTILAELKGIRADLSALGGMRALDSKVMDGQVQVITAIGQQSSRIVRLERRFLGLRCIESGQKDCDDCELDDLPPMGVADFPQKQS